MALGKKLDTLLENYFGNTPFESGKDQLMDIELTKIIVSPYQPRTHFDDKTLQSLAKNISDHGLLQPITVIDLEDGNFQLISGERRFRAFGILQRLVIPAIVKAKSALDPKQQATLGIFENLHRENLNVMDTAKSFASLKEMHGWSNQELADFLSCSKQHVENYLRLFDLSSIVQEALSKNQITEGHARLLHTFDFFAQNQIAAKIISGNLSVKAAQKMIDSLFKTKSKSIKPLTSEVREALNQWKSKYPNASISLNGSSKRGSLVIKWTKQEDFPNL
jgi:ParB family chromosome partitioning protein